ncbi:MAG: hypothetical protein KDC44_17660 [Phaeodactylibacter sp.]|nr:hypothetical protein [Phaeodactylibacter sp.]
MRVLLFLFLLSLTGCPKEAVSWNEWLLQSAWEITNPEGARFRVDFLNEAWDGGAFGEQVRRAQIKGLTEGWLGTYQERWLLELQGQQPVLAISRDQIVMERYLLAERGEDFFIAQLQNPLADDRQQVLRFERIAPLSAAAWADARDRLIGNWALSGSELLLDTMQTAPLILARGQDRLYPEATGQADYLPEFITENELQLRFDPDGTATISHAGGVLRQGTCTLSQDGQLLFNDLNEDPILIRSSMSESLILDFRAFFKTAERRYEKQTYRLRFSKIRS